MTYSLNTDGGARGNPGPAATGIVLKDSSGKLVAEFGNFLGTKTNNEAEYLAIISGLEAAAEKKVEKLDCFLDSELVVRQLNGQYKVKEPTLKILWATTKNLEAKFAAVKYTHIPREKNKEADRLVNETLDRYL